MALRRKLYVTIRRTPTGANRFPIHVTGCPRWRHSVKKARCFALVKATKNELSSSSHLSARCVLTNVSSLAMGMDRPLQAVLPFRMQVEHV
jgi:hypothetical protein